jgi:hypothetical protein
MITDVGEAAGRASDAGRGRSRAESALVTAG